MSTSLPPPAGGGGIGRGGEGVVVLDAEGHAKALLRLNRLVSASTVEDVTRSIQDVWEGLQERTIPVETLLQDVEVMHALMSLLQTGQYKHLSLFQQEQNDNDQANDNDDNDNDDGGWTSVAQIYHFLCLTRPFWK